MPKDALPALRANQQLQRRVHDFSLRLQPRQFARPAHQTLVNLNIRSPHSESIHHLKRTWCMFLSFSNVQLSTKEPDPVALSTPDCFVFFHSFPLFFLILPAPKPFPSP